MRLFWRRISSNKINAGGNGPSVVVAPVDKRLRFITALLTVNMLMIIPNQYMYYMGLKPSILSAAPFVVVAGDFFYFLAIAINPLVYATWSNDMRSAYKRTLSCTA